MKARKTLLMAFLSLFLSATVNASNVSINTVPKVEIQTGDEWATITFDISWDNSWRTSRPNNHDAIWLFVKCWDGNQWNHAYLDMPESPTHNGIIVGADENYQAGNRNGSGYYVCNLDSSVTTCDMELELGYSQVQYKWGIDPSEVRQTGVVGVFLRRSVLGQGHVNIKDVILPWTFTDQGFTADDDLVVKVYAIEMVYVPSGSFYLGAGQGSTAANNLNSFSSNGAAIGFPYFVQSAGPITVNTTAGNLWATGSIVAGTVPVTFPNGFNAFYIMKYEVTQGAYVDFLNGITEAQANGNINNGPVTSMVVGGNPMYPYANPASLNTGNYNRRLGTVLKSKFPTHSFGVDGNQNGTFDEVGAATKTDPNNAGPATVWQNDGHNVALIWAKHSHLCSYADWAGLRPMTELEYEKACRGNQDAKADEFAWGNSLINMAYIVRNNPNITITQEPMFGPASHDQGKPTTAGTGWNMLSAEERPVAMNTYTSAFALHSISWTNGAWWSSLCGAVWVGAYTNKYAEPVRVGMLAGAGTNRQGSGASYWGVMNMSDNAREPVVNASQQTVRQAFKGTHGDGQLQANGMSDVGKNDWAIFTDVNMKAYASNQVFYNRGMFGGHVTLAWSWNNKGGWWTYCTATPNTTSYGGGPVGALNWVNNQAIRPITGYVSSRHTAAHAAKMASATAVGPFYDSYSNAWSVNQSGEDVMQGIRCVRSARMTNQSTPTTGINNVIN